MNLNFSAIHSERYELELTAVGLISLPKEFVFSQPTYVYLPRFSGQIRMGQFVTRELNPSQICLFIPAGGILFFEAVTVASEAYFVSVSRASGDKNFSNLPLRSKSESFIELSSYLSDVFHEGDSNPSVLEHLLSSFSAALADTSPLKRARKTEDRGLDLYQRILSTKDYAVSVGDICDQIHLHLSQGSREFRRHFGIPPYRFWLLLRLAQSKDALRKGTPVIDVTHEFGFADQSHLTRVFKRFYKTTPLVYQKKVRTEQE